MEKYEQITFTNDDEIVGGKNVVDETELKMWEEVGLHDVWERVQLKSVKCFYQYYISSEFVS